MSVVPALRDEAVELLQELIRLDTVNPPGNETIAAELAARLPGGERRRGRADRARAGAGQPRRAPPRSRRRAVARAAVAHGHVLADASEWQLDPWSGEIRDDEIWGRGALDMKGQVAASAVALASLAREGFRPERRPRLRRRGRRGGRRRGRAAVAHAGAPGRRPRRLRGERRRRRPGRVRGAAVLPLLGRREDDRAVPAPRPRPERHASMPGVADNALLKAARLVTRLGEYRPSRGTRPRRRRCSPRSASTFRRPPTRSPPRSASTRSPARSSSRSCRSPCRRR